MKRNQSKDAPAFVWGRSPSSHHSPPSRNPLLGLRGVPIPRQWRGRPVQREHGRGETRVRTLLPSCGAEVPRRTTHHLRGTPFSACEAFQFPGSSHFPEAAPALWPSQSDCGQTKILPFPGGLANAQLLADLERGARKGDGQRGER
ncbi:hypothetical protein Q8A73_016911 [Channa argus]|nr:hypothetical protein Q8A73_016908 [Channa argus]KAK2877941.1 hypothetical protein Q8A73_016911 [Channa argus]